jgi:uncharacterized iron-regulated membrane protein
MSIRKILLNLHLWAGLAAAAFLALLGMTGSLIVFEDEIDSWLNPRPHIQPGPKRLPLNALTARLETAHPGYQVAGFTFPSRNDLPVGAFLRSEKLRNNMGVDIKPYTGEVFPMKSQQNNFTGNVHQLHTHLLMGRPGSTVMACAAVFLLFLAITGLILWWPRKVFTVRWSGRGSRLNFDLHNALGMCSSVFLLTFALTGMVIHWEGPAFNLVRYVTHSPAEAPMADASAPAPGAPTISADRVGDRGKRRPRQADVHAIGLGGSDTDRHEVSRRPHSRRAHDCLPGSIHGQDPVSEELSHGVDRLQIHQNVEP